MKRLQRGRKEPNFLLFSFLFPFLGYVAVMICSGYSPFGSSSILMSDMYHQYYPFFKEFRRTLLAGDSLLYNWNLGMGVDYLALIAYYVASPLNLLSVLVPEQWLLGFFSLLVPIKLGLAGLFFGIFLKKTFEKNDWSIPLFSACYGLCAWALGYQWNIMWLDTFALLPLAVLGMLALLQQRRFVLYTTMLFLSIVSNYYIGFFTCIFVALSFLCYEISQCHSFKRFLADLGLMAVFSALAIALTAFLEWPAYTALGNTYSSVNQFPTGFKLNIASDNTFLGLLDGMRQVAGNTAGGISPTFKEGLPNLYCGIFSLILGIQFFMSKKFSIREKLCQFFLLVFFILSFLIRQLDYIWHGFHFTNMIPYRFSFLFSFVMLVMAYRAYLIHDECQTWKTILSGLLVLGIVLCSDLRTDPVFLIYNLVFLLAYTALALGRKRTAKEADENSEEQVVAEETPSSKATLHWNQTLSTLVLLAMGLELGCNLVNFGVNFGGTDISHYPRGNGGTAQVIAQMKEREKDSDFYRTEFLHTQTLNDDALNGVSGITMFSSSANVRCTKFMAALGYGARPNYNRYSYEEGSPVSELFLNLKYLIARNETPLDSAFFEKVYSVDGIHLLENKAYLPLGFAAQIGLEDMDVESNIYGTFAYQNQLFSAATGINKDVFQVIRTYTAEPAPESTGKIEIAQKDSGGEVTYTTTDTEEHVEVSFVVPQDGDVTIRISAPKRNNLKVYKNVHTTEDRNAPLFSEKISLTQMMHVGNCAEGDVITVSFQCPANETGTVTLTGAVLHNDLYLEGVHLLQNSVLDITSMDGTKMTGTISVDKNSLLYTSIPYDENWVVELDGTRINPIAVMDSTVGLYLEPGTHEVTFTYHNTAFYQGSVISMVALILFLGITALVYSRKRKGKFE